MCAIVHSTVRITYIESTILSSLYALPFYDFDLRASHARTLLPAALASVPFGFVFVRVRVHIYKTGLSSWFVVVVVVFLCT